MVNAFIRCSLPASFAVVLLRLIIMPAEGQVLDPSNGHFYQRVDTVDGINWFDARDAAASTSFSGIHGHLATITSAEENEFVKGLFAGQVAAGEAWLGGIQPPGSPEPGGGWEWITGEPWVFTDWTPGEPNNVGATGEDALHMWTGLNNGIGFGKWNDFGSLGTFHFAPFGYVVEFESAARSVPEPGVLILFVAAIIPLVSYIARRNRMAKKLQKKGLGS